MPIGVGAAMLGSAILGSVGSFLQNREQKDLSREQMDFQERMSSTSYQRGVKDMMAAGLNPMLAYSQGGASAPMGAMPQVQNVLGAGVSSAAQGLQMVSAIQQMAKSEADIKLVEAQAKRTASETLDNSVHTSQAAANLDLTRGQKGLIDEQTLRAAEDTLSAYYGRLSARETFESAKKEGSFEADARARRHRAELLGLDVPRAKAEEDFWKKAQSAPQFIRILLEILRGARGVR